MTCADCGEEDIENVVQIKVGKRVLKLCEDCAAIRQDEADVNGAAEEAMQGMMEYKGR